MTTTQARLKRVFDVIVALVGLVVTSPLWLMGALAVLVDDGRPVLFWQTRVGQHGQPFRLCKFRTMTVGSGGGDLTIGRDSRVTRIGRWLRRTKIDEIPQLVNVLRGEMSIVGPRPELQHYVDLYPTEYRELLRMRPGLTDPASIQYRDEASLLAVANDVQRLYAQRILPDKLRLSLDYVRRPNLVRDVGIVISTLGAIVRSGKAPRARGG